MTTPERSQSEQQCREIADCVGQLLGNIVRQGERLSQRLGIPAPFIKALHTLECPMAMKDLGKRMHCDPSFVTVLADMLEKRGLARREPHPADRRIKNLVLTEPGLELKRRVEAEVAAQMPWNRALTDAERAQLLTLIHKMLAASAAGGDSGDNSDDQDAVASALPSDATAGLADLMTASLRDYANSEHGHGLAGEVSSAASDNPVAS